MRLIAKAHLSRALYSLAWVLATPLVIAYLLWRARAQPEYRRHWRERWGLIARRRDDAPLVWVHAVSVGETRAAQPLINALLVSDPALRVLLTHMTPTGRQTGAELFGAGTRHAGRVTQAYLPYDGPFAPGRFLAAWRPRAGIVMETELWPNLCAAASRAGVPLALVNARLSQRSLRKGLRWRALTAPALASLCCVLAQTADDAWRLAQLGRDDAAVTGNLKFDVEPSADMLERGRGWRDLFAGRPVVLAASTRDGEEALLLDAWVDAIRAGATPDAALPPTRAPLLVVVPRHPQRFDEVHELAVRRGLRVARRASLDLATQLPVSPEAVGTAVAAADQPGIDLLLGDSMGEMFAYYAMADIAIIGGSILPFGAQNMIESCAAGVPVVLGQHTYNFAQAAEQAIAAGAGIRVHDAEEAVREALRLALDAPGQAAAAERALTFAQTHRGATRRTMDRLGPWLRSDPPTMKT